jgi:putative inorganic carbon (hco3(-)) transporter
MANKFDSRLKKNMTSFEKKIKDYSSIKQSTKERDEQPTMSSGKDIYFDDLEARQGKIFQTLESAQNKINNSFQDNNPITIEPKKVGLENDPVIKDSSFSDLQQEVEQENNKNDEGKKNLFKKDNWSLKTGHTVTFIGLYTFTVLVFFRPYELISSLSFLVSFVSPIAVITLLVYSVTQLLNEGQISSLTTEIKSVLFMLFLSIVTMAFAQDKPLAWATLTEMYIKTILIFIVLVNALRTKRQVMGLIWISLGIAVYLSYVSINMYSKGEFLTEGYRVSADVHGMFENPNEMAIHLIMMIPIALTLGIASKKYVTKFIFFAVTLLFLFANIITFSRGGFLGLLGLSFVLVYKLGRKHRFRTMLIFFIVSALFIAVAPGNYGLRIVSIFIPSLDPVGSSGARSDALNRSIIATLRNPWGMGIGNSILYGVRNLQTHNAYTQVSSELGILGLFSYILLLISPLKALNKIENNLEGTDDDWLFYLSIGLQASMVGYMISSFFASIAYTWFVYYLIGYMVALRRIYFIKQEKIEANEFGFKSNLKFRPS